MRILGHRGAPFAAPENTVEAFVAAIDEGADGVELDVQPTADGQLVIFHDTVHDGVPVHHLTREGLAERLGRRVDVLDDVFAALPVTAWIFVEVKRQGSLAEAWHHERLIAMCHERAPGHTILGSFDPQFVAAVRENAPDLQAGWIVEGRQLGPDGRWPDNVDRWFEGLAWVSMALDLIGSPLHRRAVAAGCRTLAWSATSDAEVARVAAAQPPLDGVITKTPRATRERLSRSIGG